MKKYALLILAFCVHWTCLRAQDFKEEKSLSTTTGSVQNIRFSPDGRYVAAAGHDGHVTIWDVKTGAMIRRLQAHAREVNEVTFSKNGKLMASAGTDGVANVWETSTWRKLSSHQSKPYYQPDGKIFLSASFVVFSPDNQFIYYAGDNGFVMKAKIGSNDPAQTIFSTNYEDGRWYSTVTGGTVSADEKYLVLTVGTLVEFIDLKTEKLAKYIRYQDNKNADLDGLNDVVNAPFPNSVAVWSYDGKITFWNTNNLQKISSIQASEQYNYSAASFSKDNRYMVTAASGTVAKVWDLSNGRLVQSLSGHSRIVRLGRFSPTEDAIATASFDGTVKIWKWKKEENNVPPVVNNPPVVVVEPKKDKEIVVIRDTVVKVIRDTIRIVEKPEPQKTEEVEFEGHQVKLGETVVLKSIQFQQSKDFLLDESRPELAKVVELMRRYPKMEIELMGHTDNVGDASKNYALSERRVKTVKNYLLDKGIESSRIKTSAYGGNKPIADNRSENTRKLNRRVEMKIIKM